VTIFSANQFINFTMEYSNTSPFLLESVSINAQGFQFSELFPRSFFGIDLSLLKDVQDEGKTSFQEYIVYYYGDSRVPGQPTKIVRNLPNHFITIYNSYSVTHYGSYYYILSIASSSSNGVNISTYLTYNNDFSKITKMCQVSCQVYTYDSSSRLLSITENGQTLESYQYNSAGQITFSHFGLGSWNFAN